MDSAFDVLKLGNPTSVEAECRPQSQWSAPAWSIVTYQFPATADRGPVKLVWYDGNKTPPRPNELEEGHNLPGSIGGQLWYGTEGTIDGMDLSDLIQGGDQTPRNEFIYYSKKGVLEGLRQGDWKVRLIGKKQDLYNLAEDIGERNNLAKSQPE